MENRFSRQELDTAFERYKVIAHEARAAGDWNRYVDELFTDDARYVEHEFGTFEGKEAIRGWLVPLMSGFTEMTFPIVWRILDEEDGQVVFQAWNRLEHDGLPYQFATWTLLKYAGDDKWSYEEDMYNAKEAEKAVAEWAAAKGIAPPVAPG